MAPPAGETTNLLTVPNLITLLRLLCLPLFLYLLLGLDNRLAAGWLLAGLGATDWVDGYLARRLGQVSEFGKKFDPTVDRLLFIVAIIAIIIDGAAPVWFCWAVLIRELLVVAVVTDARAAGRIHGQIEVVSQGIFDRGRARRVGPHQRDLDRL